jgi:hypothetical protein
LKCGAHPRQEDKQKGKETKFPAVFLEFIRYSIYEFSLAKFEGIIAKAERK